MTVCEALVPSSAGYSVSGIDLPSVTISKTPDRVVVFGDSGCTNDAKQSCDGQSWPFQDVASVAASENPIC